MRIAVASKKGMVTGNFGSCDSLVIFEVEDYCILRIESILNSGDMTGFLHNVLKALEVNVVISGSMGGSVREIFREKGIEVITGAEGHAKAAAEDYLRGVRQSTGPGT